MVSVSSAEVSLDVRMAEAFVACGARAVTIATTLSITTDDVLAAHLATRGEVEHLEAFGVARACHAGGIPCAIVLGIANIVGARGREEWQANHVEASARAGEVAACGLARWPPEVDG
jgi:nucleoside phosphorylase